MYICAQAVYALGVAFAPIVPHTSGTILAMVGGENAQAVWHNIGMPLVAEGTAITVVDKLFTHISDEAIAEQIGKLGAGNTPQPVTEEPDNTITIDDFKKVALRTGTVVEAERVAKSDKLLKLIVDIGTEKRQIVAGIGKHYEPEQMVGKTVVVVANLKPAKLMGIVSQGMLLAANMPDGSLALVSPDKDGIAPGAEVR